MHVQIVKVAPYTLDYKDDYRVELANCAGTNSPVDDNEYGYIGFLSQCENAN